MRDSNLSGDIGIVNLHPIKGTHWVLFINNYYFDSYGCTPPKNTLRYIKSKYDKCIYSEYRIQKRDSLCASYCLYYIFLYHKLDSASPMMSKGQRFEKAVMNLYYSTFVGT